MSWTVLLERCAVVKTFISTHFSPSEFRSQIVIEVVYAIYVSVYAMTNVARG